jgi:hypothetical protein
MKAIIKFDLSDPDDKSDYKIYNKAMDFYFAVNNICSEIRSIEKWSEDNGDQKYEKLKEIIYESINEYQLPLD